MRTLFVISACLLCSCIASCTTARVRESAAMRVQVEYLKDKLAIPVADPEIRMSSELCPYDYLYDAAVAHCYAARQTDPAQKAIFERCSQGYHKVWKQYSGNDDICELSPQVASAIIEKYRAILALYPDHQLRSDMIPAIRTLEGYRGSARTGTGLMTLAACQGGGDGSPLRTNGWRALGPDEDIIRRHVNVVLINTSMTSWIVWPQDCREGWYNIEFFFVDEEGTTFQVRNVRVVWNISIQTDPIRLDPGDAYVRDCFIQNWEWTPELGAGVHKLKGHAIFDGCPPLGPRNVEVSASDARDFAGLLRSKEFTVTIDMNPCRYLFK